MSNSNLRQEGVQQLERMAGGRWSDFNTHDPGITLLEVLCYVLSDLAYRSAYSIPDLLASGGGDPNADLFPAPKILSTCPVTPLDLRKLVLDVEGVRNAWVEPTCDETVSLYYRAETQQLLQRSRPPVTTPVAPNGLYRVLVEPSVSSDLGSDQIYRQVVLRWLANRGLCEDLAEVRILAIEKIQIKARVEVSSVENPEAILLDIFQQLANAISPPVHFASAEELLQANTPIDELFDGPLLDHGFLVGEAGLVPRRNVLHTSDLIRAMMNLPEVKAIRSIRLTAEGSAQAWRLPLDSDKAPQLDLAGSDIQLVRAGQEVATDTGGVIDTFYRLQAQTQRKRGASTQFPPNHRRGATEPDASSELPGRALQGRDRGVANYLSLQHHLPALYGVGGVGLASSASTGRQAQARQLKAYLLFFDQLLADSFEQLAHLGDLFSAQSEDLRTYFGQMIDDPSLNLEPLYLGGSSGYRAGHLRLVAAADSLERKNHFLDHLLARFAEPFGGASFLPPESRTPSSSATRAEERLARNKLAFLRQIPFLSSARGAAFDYLLPPAVDHLTPFVGETEEHAQANVSGLEERLRLRLGLVAAKGEDLLLIEHILLRPINGDRVQQVPLLEACTLPDPYSLQLSLVLPKDVGRFTLPNFRSFTEQTLRQETPAHLTPYVRWLEAGDWSTLRQIYEQWLELLRTHRSATLGLSPQGIEPMAMTELRLRGTRDRLVDLLGVGETYPVQDPELSNQLKVAHGVAGRIRIDPGEKDVTYELRDEFGQVLQPPSQGVVGNGAETQLTTPAITADITFTVLARKNLPPNRQDYLLAPVMVQVGLDTSLPAKILTGDEEGHHTDLLAPQHHQNSDPRITDYGDCVEVRISNSQEGVAYDLVDEHGICISQDGETGHQIGNLGDITLRSKNMREDLVIRVRCQLARTNPRDARSEATKKLDTHLPLKVRPNPHCRVEPREAIGAEDDAIVRLIDSQESVQYQLYYRLLEDRDFIYAPFSEDEQHLPYFPVPGGQDVRVLNRWTGTAPLAMGFAPLGRAQQGRGQSLLEWNFGQLTDDLVMVAEARKTYQLGHETIHVSLLLTDLAMFLPLPDAEPGLNLEVLVTDNGMPGTLRVNDGQPGVFYYFRRGHTGREQLPPAYFYQLDRPILTGTWPPLSPQGIWPNKGLSKQRIEGDFVVARDAIPGEPADSMPSDPRQRAFIRPHDPILKLNYQRLDSVLKVRAVKERTQLDIKLNLQATIHSIPNIRPLQQKIDPGTQATIRVTTSHPEEVYQLFIDDTPFSEACHGTGEDLDLVSQPMNATANLDVHITRPSDPGIPVVRIYSVKVTVRPSVSDSSLLLHLPLDSIQTNSGRKVRDTHGNSYPIRGASSAVVLDHDPVHGDVLKFNGTDGSIDCGQLHRFDGSEDLTCEVWIEPQYPSDWYRQSSFIRNTFGDTFCLLYAQGYLFFNRGYHSKSFPLGTSSTWRHLAIVSQPDLETAKFYVGGQLTDSLHFPCRPLVKNNAFTIGDRRPLPVSLPFQGRLSQVRIYNRALTAEEIQADLTADQP